MWPANFSADQQWSSLRRAHHYSLAVRFFKGTNYYMYLIYKHVLFPSLTSWKAGWITRSMVLGTTEVKQNSRFWRILSWNGRKRRMQQLEESPSCMEDPAYKTICRSGSTMMVALHNWRDKVSIFKNEEKGSDAWF